MPTGYTAKLYEGEPQTVTEFILSCARAMGALITMRDEPVGAPIPDAVTPHTEYQDRSIAEAQARLAELHAMTAEEATEAANAQLDKALAQRAEAERDRALIQRRYETMLRDVRAWEPPTPEHVGLKKFMVDQLEESIRFDCSPMSWPEIPPLTADAWLDAEIARAERSLAYAREERQKEIDRTEGRNQWIRALLGSLPARAELTGGDRDA